MSWLIVGVAYLIKEKEQVHILLMAVEAVVVPMLEVEV
jgi:hypothetical protein